MKNLVDITIFLIIQFIFITLLLIYIYQGGSVLHPYAEGFIFSENFLSDLGRFYYYNGSINPFSIFFTLSLTFVGIATGTFFYIFSKFCNQRRYLPLFFGILAGAGLIGLSVFWSDITHEKHIYFGRLAYMSFYFASVSLNLYMKRNYFPAIYNLLIVLNVLLTLFIIFMFLTDFQFVNIKKDRLIHLTAILQKIIISAQIVIVVYILHMLKKLNKKINIL